MVNNKTRKLRSKSKSPLEHHHVLVRFETMSSPSESQKEEAMSKIKSLLTDISMNILADPHAIYVKEPRWNEGMTVIAPIQTSHIAFHFWKHPVKWILHHPDSKCLLQLDIYTCGSLSGPQIARILSEFSSYGLTHVDTTLLNRQMTLYIDRQRKWDVRSTKSWDTWLQEIAAER